MEIEIKTNRLILTPLGVKYIDTVHEYATDIENCKYMCFLPNASIEETKAFLEKCDREWAKKSPGFFEFAIIFENKHIGAVSAHLEAGNAAELGWIINKEYWKRGIATEAARALVDYLSKEFSVKRFIAHCDSENAGSYKLMEKLGMVKTGEWGGRKNKSSDEERREFRYESIIN